MYTIQDAAFVQQFADANMTAIDEGLLALAKSPSAAVGVYGAWLVTDHSSANVMLYEAAAGAPIPGALDPADQMQVSMLSVQFGSAFDVTFLTDQMQANEATLQDLQTETINGGNAGLISFAESMFPMVTAHLDAAENLLALNSSGGPAALQAAMTPQFLASMASDFGVPGAAASVTPSAAPVAPHLTGGSLPHPPSAADLIAPHTAHWPV